MVRAAAFFSARALWISGVLTVLFQIVIGWVLKPVGSPLKILMHQITLDPSYFQFALNLWGPEKVGIFLTHYYFDFVYPLVYSYFLACCIYRLYISKSRWLLLIPFTAGLLDIVENICQMLVILNRVPLTAHIFYVGAYSARAKWLFIFISLIVIVFGLIRRKSSLLLKLG